MIVLARVYARSSQPASQPARQAGCTKPPSQLQGSTKIQLEESETTDEGQRGEKETDEGHTAGVDDGDAAKDLEEAYKVIKYLRAKINEVNLLNAKLLFSNKIFRNKGLSESQKMKVIENLDRAKSVREVKLVYTTLSESLSKSEKPRVTENFASKGTNSTAPS